MSIFKFFLFLLPLGLGFFLRGRIKSGPIHRAVTDVLFPLLVLYLLLAEPPALPALGICSIALLMHVFLMLPLALLATRLLARRRGEMVLPIMFMNSGFLGIGATLLFAGKAAAGYAVLFDQAMTIAIYTIGLALVIPGGAWRGVIAVGRAPAFWAFIVALAAGALGWRPPELVLHPLSWIGVLAVPTALFAVGLDLRASRKDFYAAVPAAVLRLAGGTGVGILTLVVVGGTAHWFDAGGAIRTVIEDPSFRRMIWIEAGMPSAVFAAVLPARYGAGGSLASTIVLISTLLFPLWFLLLQWCRS